MRQWIIMMTASFLLLSGYGPSADAAAVKPDAPGSRLDQQVQVWIAGLSNQKGFEEWPSAGRETFALGPGTHGWLVTLMKEDKTIGYMVVHAAKDGSFHLTEYGPGDRPLFAEQTLHEALIELGLIHSDYKAERLYIDPFLAGWRIQTGNGVCYLDAKTGEQWLITDQDWLAAASRAELYMRDHPAGGAAMTTVEQSLFVPTFDPYSRLPWLSSKAIDTRSFKSSLLPLLHKKAQLRMTAEPFGDKLLVVWPVAGFHSWHKGPTFIALQQNGKRFVGFETLQRLGHYYK